MGQPSALHIRSADRLLAVDLDAAETLCLLLPALLEIRSRLNECVRGSLVLHWSRESRQIDHELTTTGRYRERPA